MNLSDLSLRRPTFITCIVFLMLAIGWLSFKQLGVDLFPDVTFPVVTITTPYPGAGPSEIETLISKPIEDEVSTLNGMKRLSSINSEGVSTVVAEFSLETDVKFAEQQIRDRVGSAKRRLPVDAKEPVIRRIDPADQPVLVVSITADLPPAKLYDLANEVIKPKFERVPQVGLVEVIGGRRREIHVKLDRNKLRSREISASLVAQRLAASGENIPVGKMDQNGIETVYRTMGEFNKLSDIAGTVVNFFGNEVPITVSDVGTVEDTLTDEKSRTFVNGERTVFLYSFRQSGANTIDVVDGLKKTLTQANADFEKLGQKVKLDVVQDGSLWIRANVTDVKESIFIGITLAVIVVFFFLGSARSTFITGLALPNSLIGAFILMALAGFTINVMSLLALSLSVGLLIDDAIVVRENIFRHLEMGKDPQTAAREGTAEVRLAVIATTLAVIAVFGPVGFVKGVIGQFLKEFGLTVCFAMMISLFDALTIAPMLSAYFAGKVSHLKEESKQGVIARALKAFDRFQTYLENKYEKIIQVTIKRPRFVLGISFVVFALSLGSCVFVPKAFLPPQDAGEFAVSLDTPPGTSLDKMTEITHKIDQVIRSNKEVRLTAVTVGGRDGEANKTEMYVSLVPYKDRKLNTIEVKELVRDQLKSFAEANPIVKDYDAVGGGQRPFNINIISSDQKALEEYTKKLFEYVKKSPVLKDVDLNFRPGKPEFQVQPNKTRMEALGISSILLGQELRTQIEGQTAAKFREAGLEYDVRVRLKEDQRNLENQFASTSVPNINGRLIRLPDVAAPVSTSGPAKIYRMDRNRYIQISADYAPNGDTGALMDDLDKKFKSDPELKLPSGFTYAYVGQAENFVEMMKGMVFAMGLGVIFIFLVLASLYESFVTPFTIMLALPLALCGSFVALLVGGQSMNIFSMIGMVMLLGVASKNSILLVDFANQKVQEGKTREEAILLAGRTRLRPILMTTMALIAGTIPIAMGLNEASRQRVSMGWAIIGGLISSTLLTLIVVPAAYGYIDRFRVWAKEKAMRLAGEGK